MDRFVLERYRNRIAQAPGAGIVLAAWLATPPNIRASMILAQGDPQRAAAVGGTIWKQFVEGKLGAVFEGIKQSGGQDLKQLEAEAFITAGAVMPGLARLNELHKEGDPAATVSLARRLHMLGHHEGAEQVSGLMPWHAHVALTGARAAMANKKYDKARAFIEPLLNGLVPVPESAAAGALAVLTAALLAGMGEMEQLQGFGRRLLMTPDLPEDMLPTVARVAWIAGFPKEAWQRFHAQQTAWSYAACFELAVLAGNLPLAKGLHSKAGPAAAPAAAALPLMDGSIMGTKEEAEKIFSKDANIHIWRTHPTRWQPWINAAEKTPANVSVFDLSAGQIPRDADAIPHMALDDGALLELLPPIPVRTARKTKSQRVWLGDNLCKGVSRLFDWPASETQEIEKNISKTTSKEKAAVQILNAEEALLNVGSGKRIVVIASPGDPFWIGPLPERAWPNMRIIKPDPQNAWQGAGDKVIEAVESLLDKHLTKNTEKSANQSANQRKRQS